jgi:hypothetical protein
VANFEESNPAAGYLGIVIALCFWFSVFILEYMGSTRLFRAPVRKVLSDYAYPVSIDNMQTRLSSMLMIETRLQQSSGLDFHTSPAVSKMPTFHVSPSHDPSIRL